MKLLKTWGFVLVAIPLVLLLTPLVLLWLLLLTLVKIVILHYIWLVWGLQGKDMLVVYSDSPYWKNYFENGLLPQIHNRSHLLNWSARSKWQASDLKTIAFHFFKGEKEFNPMIVLFTPFRWPKRFQFYQAFKDFKHGKEHTLEEVEQQFFEALEKTLSNPHPRPSA